MDVLLLMFITNLKFGTIILVLSSSLLSLCFCAHVEGLVSGLQEASGLYG